MKPQMIPDETRCDRDARWWRSGLLSRIREIIALSIVCASMTGYASATEIKCLFPLAFKSSLGDVVPQFEKSTGNTVTIDYATIGALTARLKKSEIADVAIVSGEQFAELQQNGKLVAGSRVEVAKLGDGAFVRRGAPKPDISSVEAFKRTLLASKAIAYINPAAGAPSGIYMARLMERLGIADHMNAKTKLATGSGKALFDIVVNGDAEIGFIQITELLAEPKVELLGPLPAAVQDYTKYAAGLVATGKEPDAAKALITFITSPSTLAVMKMRGFEPL
jgi:molybdate transport system substrate-binding protein